MHAVARAASLHRWLAACLLAVVLAAPAQAQDAQHHFEEGNARYAEGAFDEAVQAYQEALEEGEVSAALYQNLGSAYFRTGDLPQAVRHFLLAERLAPEDPRIQHNIELAAQRRADEMGALPPTAWAEATQGVARRAAWVLAGGVLVALLGAALLALVLLGQGSRHVSVRTASAVLALGLLVACGALLASALGQPEEVAVVAEEAVELRAQPAEGSEVVTDVHAGLPVTLHSASAEAGFVAVRLPDGREGFLPRAALLPVE